MFCKKEDHLKNFKFCRLCAAEGKQVNQVFFCQRCQKTRKQNHDPHTDQVIYVNHQKFINPVGHLKGLIKDQVKSLREKCQRNGYQDVDRILNKLKGQKEDYLKLIDQTESFTKLILNPKVMAWLLKIKFWQAENGSAFINLESRIKNQLQTSFINQDKQIQKVVRSIQRTSEIRHNQFSIDWGYNQVDQAIDKQLYGLGQQIQRLKKEKQIFGLIISLFSSYSQQQCYKVQGNCQQLIKRYPAQKVLYLSMIRLNQLLPGGNKQIPKILKQITNNIDPSFQSTDLYQFYTAMSNWQLVDQLQPQDGPMFFQLKNKCYYKLNNVDGYIGCLNKAIAIRERPSYYVSLGIGFIVKKSYLDALRVFRVAQKLIDAVRNDALDLNKFWAQSNLDSGLRQFDAIMQNLQTRNLQFVTIISKYFKNNKNYSELVSCCQQLIVRQPTNFNFKIQFIKSILYYSSSLQGLGGNINEKISRAQMMIIQLKRARQKQARKLQKRLMRMKARHSLNSKDYNEAISGYQQLARGTKLTSASDYYNLSATLFNMFVSQGACDQDLVKKAHSNIERALKLKSESPKYKKLKYFICCYMNMFNEANKLHKHFQQTGANVIDSKQYERLFEHVQANMESEYQTPIGSS